MLRNDEVVELIRSPNGEYGKNKFPMTQKVNRQSGKLSFPKFKLPKWAQPGRSLAPKRVRLVLTSNGY